MQHVARAFAVGGRRGLRGFAVSVAAGAEGDGAAVVGEVQVAEFDVTANRQVGGPCVYFGQVGDVGLLDKNLVNARHGRRSALEDVDDPAERDDRPGELHHVGVERDEIADGHAAEQNFAPAQPKHEHDRDAEQQFERGPEHAHQAHQLQAARNVFLVRRFEFGDLRPFLRVGADHAHAGEVLLHLRRDLAEHRLDALEALVNAPPEILDHDAGNGQRQKRIEREPRTDRDHEDERARGEHDGIGGVHDRRAEQHADGVEVVGGARHDVARARALIERIGERFQVLEEVVAQVEFDFARDADHDPARQELEEALGGGNGDEQQGIDDDLVLREARAGVADHAAHDGRDAAMRFPAQVVHRPAQHLREQDPDPVHQQNGAAAQDVAPLVFAEVGEQGAEVLEHG